MRLRNNKGFSLIDVLVGVAILALLITPILWQVGKTIEVNKASKERQYAIENADNVLEYIQGVPASDLSNMTIPIGGNGTIDGKVNFTSMNHFTDVECEIYCRKNPSGPGIFYYNELHYYYDALQSETYREIDESDYISYGTVKYDVTNYTLDDIDLGHDKNSYSRNVVVDNLFPNLAAESLIVRTDYSADARQTFIDEGWEFTSEGACVKYDSDDHIVAIVCEKFNDGVLNNPNGEGLAYMQDLNKKRVAIIQGNSMSYDAQAQVDLMALKIDRLRRTNFNSWKQYIQSDTDMSIFSTSLYSDNVSKLTKISITSGYDTTSSRKYYDVKCDVIYEDYMVRHFQITEEDAPSDSVPEVLTYNAYTQRFFTNQAPDIYLVYEPYIYTGLSYSANDYIVTYDGVLYGADEKHSKLYLIKPNTAKASTSGDVYLNSSGDPVNVYLNYLSLSDGAVDPSPDSAANEPMDIYTNMSLESATMQFKNNLTINNASTSNGPTYGVNYGPNLTNYFSVLDSFENSAPDPLTDILSYSDSIRRFNYDLAKVHPLEADTIIDDRLFTVTVTLSSDSTDIRLTGAKGAE